MHGYTSKQLFKVNGGDKIYIHKDGFGDLYSATEEEERQWTEELIAESLEVLEHSQDMTKIEHAIDTLLFHLHPGVDVLLLNRVLISNPQRKLAFATALWRFFRIRDSFRIIRHVFDADPVGSAEDVFRALGRFGDHPLARPFVESAITGSSSQLAALAAATARSWEFADQPSLTYRKRMNLK